jgi:hypothetical protein
MAGKWRGREDQGEAAISVGDIRSDPINHSVGTGHKRLLR